MDFSFFDPVVEFFGFVGSVLSTIIQGYKGLGKIRVIDISKSIIENIIDVNPDIP